MSGISGGGARSDVVARVLSALNRFDILRIDGISGGEFGAGGYDYFVDETGVDTGASSGQSYSGASDKYSTIAAQTLIAGATGTKIGTMTANGGLAAAFDGSKSQSGGACAAQLSAAPAYIGKSWTGTKTVYGFAVTSANDEASPGFGAASGVTTFTLQGSSDNFSADVNDLGSVAGAVAAGGTLSVLSGLTTTTAYAYHRLKIEHNGSTVNACEVEFYEGGDAGVYGAISLVSQSFTAASAPSSASVVILVADLTALALNTDIVVSVSRDGGSTYTAVSLADEGDFSGARRVLSGVADLSSQPSGTAMRWKIESANGVGFDIHAASLLWG